MRELGAFEAKNTFGSLLDQVKNGEVISITRHERPVAQLVPNDGAVDRAQVKAAMERVRARASSQRIGFDFEEFKRDRDAGHR